MRNSGARWIEFNESTLPANARGRRELRSGCGLLPNVFAAKTVGVDLVASREFNLRDEATAAGWFHPFEYSVRFEGTGFYLRLVESDSPFCVAANRFVESHVKYCIETRSNTRKRGFNLCLSRLARNIAVLPVLLKTLFLRGKHVSIGKRARFDLRHFYLLRFFRDSLPRATLLVATGDRSCTIC